VKKREALRLWHAKAGEPLPVAGYAQVGVSGLAKVQVRVRVQPAREPWPADDPYFTTAPWVDAEILPRPFRKPGRCDIEALPLTIG
jgi:hypothetical protein